MADASRSEEDQLRIKFRSLAFTAPQREQKMRTVSGTTRETMGNRSYDLWKRANPAFLEQTWQSTAHAAQNYELSDYQNLDKQTFRTKDRHTEYVEYAVRDKALARAKK